MSGRTVEEIETETVATLLALRSGRYSHRENRGFHARLDALRRWRIAARCAAWNPSSLWPSESPGRCSYCGDRPGDQEYYPYGDLEPRVGPLQREHIVPRSRGGPDEPWNLTPACRNCNNTKSTRPALGFRMGELRDDFGPSPSRLTEILRRRSWSAQLRADYARLMELLAEP